MNTHTVRLTSLAHGGGCGCKLAPSVLQQLLADQPATRDLQAAPGRHGDVRRRRGLAGRRQHLRDRHHRLLHADGRRPVRLRPHRRDQRHLRRLCDGRQADHGARHPRHAGRQDPGRDGARDPEGRRGGLRHGRHPGRRRPFDRLPRAGLRARGDRHLPSEPGPPQRRRQARRRPDPDQAGRRRHLLGRHQEERPAAGRLPGDDRRRPRP